MLAHVWACAQLANKIFLVSAVPVSSISGPGCNWAARCTCCRYGIPFPVLARASFGIRGANLPALMRCVAQLLTNWTGA